MRKIKGIFVALSTPYDEQGKVNHAELKKHVRRLIDKNVDGFYVCGSTGEAFLLSSDERKAILETVCEANNGEKTIIAHVAQISTEQALDLGRHAKSMKVDAISAIAPFYYQFTIDEIKRYYLDLMEGMQMPFFIYNFPVYSGFTLTPEILDKLCGCPYLTGVKFTDSDCCALERMKNAHPQLTFLYGNDEMMLSGLVAGADGAIGSTYNVLSDAARGIYNSFMDGDMSKALEYQHVMNDMMASITKYSLFPSIKEVLSYENIHFGSSRKPFLPVSEVGKTVLRHSYDKYCLELERLSK